MENVPETSDILLLMEAVGGLPGICCVAALVMIGFVLYRLTPEHRNENADEERKEE